MTLTVNCIYDSARTIPSANCIEDQFACSSDELRKFVLTCVKVPSTRIGPAAGHRHESCARILIELLIGIETKSGSAVTWGTAAQFYRHYIGGGMGG
jgi:hypothetical protein